MSYENLTEQQLELLRKMREFMRDNPKVASDMSIRFQESDYGDMKPRQQNYNNIHEEHGPQESLSDKDIALLESMYETMRNNPHLASDMVGRFNDYSDESTTNKYIPKYQNQEMGYGSAESLSMSEIQFLEGMNKFIRNNPKAASDMAIRFQEGDYSETPTWERTEQKTKYAESMPYLLKLNKNPTIFNEADFKAAIANGIVSNEIIVQFFSDFTSKLNERLNYMLSQDPNDKEFAAKAFQHIEAHLNVYGRLIYELKVQEATIDCDLHLGEDIKDSMRDVQRRYGKTFQMPIPARFNGEVAFSYQGPGIPVIDHFIDKLTPQYYGNYTKIPDEPEIEMGE